MEAMEIPTLTDATIPAELLRAIALYCEEELFLKKTAYKLCIARCIYKTHNI